jgi:putative acetyltransferase
VALGEQVVVRVETPDDGTAIGLVNQAAFGGEDEARLVEALRTEDLALISLVAEVEDRIVGHVLFSRMAIETAAGTVPAVALAPVAVLPGYQRQGVGGRLIRRGLDLLRDRGEQIVIVVGHAAYYPRFGFSTDKARALGSPFARDVFMALELSPGALEGVDGRVRYPAAFGI